MSMRFQPVIRIRSGKTESDLENDMIPMPSDIGFYGLAPKSFAFREEGEPLLSLLAQLHFSEHKNHESL
jgi:hypothetical protein